MSEPTAVKGFCAIFITDHVDEIFQNNVTCGNRYGFPILISFLRHFRINYEN